MRIGTALSLLLVLLASEAAFAAPALGQRAPDFSFEGVSPSGEPRTYTLADYVGEGARKKGVVVAWFPKAFTPG